MSTHPKFPIARSELEVLIAKLEVHMVRLAECLVSPGWRLCFAAMEMPAIHYNLTGRGQLTVGDTPAIPLAPHTLVIAPAGQPFCIDVATEQGIAVAPKVVEARWQPQDDSAAVKRLVAGRGDDEDGDDANVTLICGYFRASYGTSIDLFAALPLPIVERFEPAGDMESRLREALVEINAQQLGARAMTATLLKQVLVTLLRRILVSADSWLEQLSMLSDPQIARAFAAMLAQPGAPHSISALSQTVGLGRSTFMARFTAALGCSPMAALRQLRMREAARLLAADNLSVEQVAYAVGYASRSSFFRAFRDAYTQDPLAYRSAARRWPNEGSGERGL